jgi:hypothetical protein
LESGALSAKEFPAFAQEVVPFLHVTTRITGHPYDGLLSEKGFRGFPSLAFMDAEGNVIARQSERTVEGFHKTLDAVKKFMGLKERVAQGEKNLEFPLLAAEWELGTLEWEPLKQRIAALPKLTKEQQAQADQMLLDAEVLHVSSTVRDAAAMAAAGTRFQEMMTAGYAPGPRAEMTFWSLLLRWADEKGDLATYEKAAAYMKNRFSKDPNMAEAVKALDARLAELRGKVGQP